MNAFAHEPPNYWSQQPKKTPWYKKAALWVGVGALAVGAGIGMLVAPDKNMSDGAVPYECLNAIQEARNDRDLMLYTIVLSGDFIEASSNNDLYAMEDIIAEIESVSDSIDASSFDDMAYRCEAAANENV